MSDKTSYTASEARSNLYSLIKKAQTRPIEIKLRGANPVVLMSKGEVESLEETIEILSIPGARESILEALKEPRSSGISHAEMLKKIGLKR